MGDLTLVKEFLLRLKGSENLDKQRLVSFAMTFRLLRFMWSFVRSRKEDSLA
jgi:hypothetical protein